MHSIFLLRRKRKGKLPCHLTKIVGSLHETYNFKKCRVIVRKLPEKVKDFEIKTEVKEEIPTPDSQEKPAIEKNEVRDEYESSEATIETDPALKVQNENCEGMAKRQHLQKNASFNWLLF